MHLLGHAQGGTVALALAARCTGAGRTLGSCVAAAPMGLPELGRGGGGGGGCWKAYAGGGSTGSDGSGSESGGGIGNGGGALQHEATPVLEVESMPRGPTDVRRLMLFWSGQLSRRPTAADLASAGLAAAAPSAAPAAAACQGQWRGGGGGGHAQQQQEQGNQQRQEQQEEQEPGGEWGLGGLLEVRPGEVTVELVGPSV